MVNAEIVFGHPRRAKPTDSGKFSGSLCLNPHLTRNETNPADADGKVLGPA